MSRFRQIEYSTQTQSVVIGAGLKWDDVYAALDPHNVTVVGGRVSGVGVAGITLGGGGLNYRILRLTLTVQCRLVLSLEYVWSRVRQCCGV